MLGKLLKYDLKWIYKVVIVFYILALIFACLGRALGSIKNSLAFSIISQVCNGFAISMMVSSLINTFMRAWVRFMRNIYKDESYLTHTLPVGKKTIYLSKVLAATIVVFTTMLVILACLAICYYSKTNIQKIKADLDIAASALDSSVTMIVLTIFVVATLEMLFITLVGYLGIILGYRSDNNKTVKSIIYGIVMYMLTQALTLLIIYICGLYNSDIMNLINTTNMVKSNAIKTVMGLGTIIYIVYIIVYFYIGKIQLEKGVNVD